MAAAAPAELVQRFETLRSDRLVFESRWEQIRRFQRPDAMPFFDRPDYRGTRDTGAVYDNTAEDAADLAAAGIGGLLTGQAIDWHGWTWTDKDLQEDFQAQAWLDDASRRQLQLYRNPAAKFGAAMDAVYLDLIDFANACLFIRQRRGGPPLFLARPIQQIYWAVNDDGEIDTVFWHFVLTARQAARKWGVEALPEKIAKEAEDPGRSENRHGFLHAVFPSDDPQAGQYALGPKAWASCWLAMEEKREIERGGFDSLPYIPFRWRVRAGERYGRGPSDKALADVATLQGIERMTIQTLEQAVEPTLMVPDDGVDGGVSLRTGQLVYVRPEYFLRGGDPIRPLNSGVRPDISEDAAEARRQRIRRAFLTDILQIIRDPRATATQVLEIREEQFRSAAPIVNGLEAESLGPLALRTFDLMLRGNMFRPAPPQILGRDFEPRFDNPSARAQRLAYVRGYSQLWQMLLEIAQHDPGVLDVVDNDEGVRRAADALNVPLDILRSPEQVAQMREERRQLQERLREQEAAKDASTVAKNLAPALQAAADTGALDDGADPTAVTTDQLVPA